MKNQQKQNISWIETHHEIVSAIAISLHLDEPDTMFIKRNEEQGTAGLYELAEELTDKFELLNKDREWDGEFFDEIEEFIQSKKYDKI
jgi:tRNA uridine 5-carbamoylmethylation protein Kti12